MKWIRVGCVYQCAIYICLLSSVASSAEIRLPPVDPSDRVVIRGDELWQWTEGQYDVVHLVGDCTIQQAGRKASGRQMMLWIDRQNLGSEEPTKVIAYLEDGVEVQFGFNITEQKLQDQNWLGRYYTRLSLDVAAKQRRGEPKSRPTIAERMKIAHEKGDRFPVQQVQFTLPPANNPTANASQIPNPVSPVAPGQVGNQQFQVAPQQMAVPQQIPSAPIITTQQPNTFQQTPQVTVPPSQQTLPAPIVNGQPVPQDGAPGFGGLNFQIGDNSIEIASRGSTTPTEIQQIDRQAADGSIAESVLVLSKGVQVIIRDVKAQLAGGGTYDLGAITFAADRAVAWLPPIKDLFGGNQQNAAIDGELYLEGDIVFQQGERKIYAKRMYYNVAREYGVILAADLNVTTPQYDGHVRLKADVLQQVAKGEFIANGAAVTTSRLGTPRYWLQSEQVRFTDNEINEVDPYSGSASVIGRDMRATSRNNFVYLSGFPVLYWPVFATNLQNPSYYLSGAKVKNDSIFGTQVFLDFDGYQLLGIDQPIAGTEWEISADYLSERGPAGGSQYRYTLPNLLGLGPANGYADVWGIYDSGLDTLGIDRRNLTPEKDLRGRAIWRHKHYLPSDWEATVEVGLLSDRNFLEQYIEQEWDQDKDHTTGGRLRKYYGSQLFDFSADVRANDFYTDNNELPRFDHYLLGSDLLEIFTWTAHTSVSYSKLEVDELPTDPVDAAKFVQLPWEQNREGLRAATRHELGLPIDMGPVKAVPFVSGEFAYWGEDVNGNDLTRFLGQAGVRGSLPMWQAFPQIQSSLLNLRGLAHKMEWQGEFFFAEADKDLSQLPMYDQLDDNAQEQFRRRFFFNTYGLVPGNPFPAKFDPRLYAVRMGLQRNVTSPSTEIAEDLMQGRIGLHNRWQTKRGLPGRERIVDLAQLDVDMFFYPDGERDNFGEVAGPLTYDFRYHAGDRVTVLSDGYFDFFAQGLRTFSAGLLASRPGVGDFYTGVLSLEGPISSTVLQGTVDYRMSEKWILSAGTTFDIGRIGNVGQQLGLTRIGESALIRLGITVDDGRDNVGFQFRIEPRFLPNRKLGRLGGQLIPPPGAEGLE